MWMKNDNIQSIELSILVCRGRCGRTEEASRLNYQLSMMPCPGRCVRKFSQEADLFLFFPTSYESFWAFGTELAESQAESWQTTFCVRKCTMMPQSIHVLQQF
jgi:hypothetical protein